MSLLASEYLKTQETWNKERRSNPCMLRYVPDILKAQEMCIKAAEEDPWQLKYVPDHFKMQERCDKAAKDDPSYLKYVSDRFVTREGVCMWYDDSEYWADDEDNFLKWYDWYKEGKAQKASIKEEPARKKRQKNCGSNMLM